MEKFLKNFRDWFRLKPKLDRQKKSPAFVKEGEMYWFHCEENIGNEISGKNKDFIRPCVVYKKLSHYLFLVIPASSKIKTGSWFSVFSLHREKNKLHISIKLE